MEPLIKITTIPIAIELKVNNARLEYKHNSAELEVSRDKGGLKIKSRPIKVNIDTFEARNMVSPTTKTSVQQSAQKGKSAAYEATATLAQEGRLMLNATFDQDVLSQIISSRNPVAQNFGFEVQKLASPNITWSDPDLTIQYQMDKLNFDWKISKGDFEFIPGDIEISIKQRPDVLIEYIGGPIYVPPSADPNYAPVDVKA